MRVFLPHGFAFEVSTYCGHCGLIRRIEHIGQRAMPGAVAFMHHLQYLDRGDQGGSSEVLERPTFLYARGFDVEALRFHDAEQLLDGPTLPIEADDPPGCRKVRRGVRCQQTPMWRLDLLRRIELACLHEPQRDLRRQRRRASRPTGRGSLD